ncbi:MAG: hypothetical protein JO191_04810 [Mycobacteriaceae bacterium]|nr:hypothetical protein [Mycobacteriaceae bacterium]MBV9515193.1 hypothetical protein [Mycobacteriaceae bacterium]
MSWLFVALIPALLMLATFGLERLESTLNRGCVGAEDVAEFLAQAQPGDMRTLARDGMPEALDCLRRRRVAAGEPVGRARVGSAAFSSRARVHAAAMGNPQFRQT